MRDRPSRQPETELEHPMQLLRASFEFMSPKRTHGLAERSPAIMALSAGLARSRELYSLKSQQWARMLSAWAAADSCNRRPAGEAGHQSMSKLSLRRTRKISSESVCRPQLEGVFKLFEPNIRSCRFEMGTCCVEAGVARPQRPPKKIRHPKNSAREPWPSE